MIDTARKAVASAVTVLSGWGIFVLQSGPQPITPEEWGLLIGGLATVFVTWLVPNAPPPAWTPQRRLEDRGAVDIVTALVIVFLVVVLCRMFGLV